MNRSIGTALLMLATTSHAQWSPETEWGAAPFTADYIYANGRLASPQYRSFAGVVPAELDLRRVWVNALVTAGAMLADQHTEGIVDGPGFSYGRITHLVNAGTGTLSGDYVRLACEGTFAGYCIGHKTAVSCDRAPGWGCWGFQSGIGKGVDIWHIVSADRGEPVSVPYVEVVAGDLEITQAVWQWNVRPGSTGDALRIVGPEGVRLRITADGRIILPSGRVLE